MARISPYRWTAGWLATGITLAGLGGIVARGQEDLAAPTRLTGTPGPPAVAVPATIPAAEAQVLPINLAAALQLGNARNLDVALASQRLRLAGAQLAASQVLWLPNLILGTDYYRHDGQIQDIQGNVFGTSKQGMMLGGAPALTFALTDAIFAPLAARQVVRAREAALQATSNDTMLAITQAYFNVQQARGQLAGLLDSIRRTRDLMRRLDKLAPAVLPALEITRARVLVNQQEQAVLQSENNWRAASAELVRVLHLDPAVILQPQEPPQLQVTLLGLEAPVEELLALALTSRPELAGQQALVQAAVQQLRQERARPLLPSLYVRGFSTPVTGSLAAGYFGGGINGGLGNFSMRQDWDVQMLWQLQNFGLGNRALVRQRGAANSAARIELLRIQDRVASEVVQAYALAQTAGGRVRRTETALQDARELVEKELLALTQTQGVGERLVPLVRPQEVAAAIQMLQQAYMDYFLAVADFNRAQFQLYRALGTPAQSLLDDPRCRTLAPQPPSAPAPIAPVRTE